MTFRDLLKKKNNDNDSQSTSSVESSSATIDDTQSKNKTMRSTLGQSDRANNKSMLDYLRTQEAVGQEEEEQTDTAQASAGVDIMSRYYNSSQLANKNAQNELSKSTFDSMKNKVDNIAKYYNGSNKLSDDMVSAYKTLSDNGYKSLEEVEENILDGDLPKDVTSAYKYITDNLNKISSTDQQSTDTLGALAKQYVAKHGYTEDTEDYQAYIQNAEDTENYYKNSAKEIQNAMSDFDTEQDYNLAVAQAEENAKTSDDLQKEYDKKKAEYDSTWGDFNKEYAEIGGSYNNNPFTTQGKNANKKLQERTNQRAELGELQRKIDQKKELENEKKYYTDFRKQNPEVAKTLDAYYDMQSYEEEHSKDALDTYDREELKEKLKKGKLPTDSLYTDEEKKAIETNFNSLKTLDGWNVDQIYKYYKRAKDREKAEKENENIKNFADKHPIASTAISTLNMIPSAFESSPKQVASNIDKWTGGDGYYNPEESAVYQNNLLQQEVASNIDNPLGRLAYQQGVSLIDNAIRMGIAYANPAVGLSMMGAEVATQGFNDTVENGGSVEQALATGLAYAGVEVLTEGVSLGKLKAFKNGGVKEFKSILKNAGKQILTEASEEVSATLLDSVADEIINGSLSQLETEYDRYIDSGMSETEAGQAVMLNYGGQIIQDAIGGALMGGISGTAVNTSQYRRNIKAGKSISSLDNIDTVKNLAKHYGLNDSVTDYESNPTDARLGALRSEAYEKATESMPSEKELKKVIKKANLASDKNVIANKLTNGENLTDDDLEKIKKSENLKSLLANDVVNQAKSARLNQQTALLSADTKLFTPSLIEFNAEKSDADANLNKSETLNKFLSENAKNMTINTDTVNKIKDAYNGLEDKIEPDTFAMEYARFYNQGVRAVAFKSLNSTVSQLPYNVQVSAYEDGLNKYTTALKAGNALSKLQQEWKEKTNGYAKGTVDTSALEGIKLNDEQKASVNYISGYANHGLNVKFYASRTDENGVYIDDNGGYDSLTNTIMIDINAKKETINDVISKGAMMSTFGHELSHLAEHAPTEYAELSKAIQDAVGADTFNDAVDKHYSILEERNSDKWQKMSDDKRQIYATREAVAEFSSDLVNQSKILEKMSKENPSVGKKFINFIKKVISKIKNILKDNRGMTDEARLLANTLASNAEKLQSIVDKYEKAVIEGLKNQNAKMAIPQSAKNSAKAIFGENAEKVEHSISHGVQASLRNAPKLAESAINYNKNKKAVAPEVLKQGTDDMLAMANAMLPYLGKKNDSGTRYLPDDNVGDSKLNTVWKNGSYGRTGENSTMCPRTLAYEMFKEMVGEAVGRPLTVSESLLVSQKIYDIAVDPQCIYCYVAADRKAYDEYIGKYYNAMDKFIKNVRDGANPDVEYEKYLDERNVLQKNRDTKTNAKRKQMWTKLAQSGKDYITSEQLVKRETRNELRKNRKYSAQIADAERFAQSASWAKKVSDYVAYNGEIRNFRLQLVDTLNHEYGYRLYSFSDYTPAYITENMQMLIDMSLKGLKGLSYTKDIGYAKIFAPTGMAINVSCYAKWDNKTGTYIEDNRQGADWESTKELREQYKNIGAVMVATNDKMVEWALNQDWIDVVIPYHIVKTGTKIASVYDWNNFTRDSADYKKNKKVEIYPTEHNNDFKTFQKIIEERGITPRFNQWYQKALSGEITEEQYMKLVNEVRLPASELSAVKPVFDLDSAYQSFGFETDGKGNRIKEGNQYKLIEGGFIDKGGYEGGWFKEGYDVSTEAQNVANDIKAGNTVKDVKYGVQSIRDRYQANARGSSFLSDSEVDNQYSQAVKSNDIETAQKLVDEKAMSWGAYSEDGKTPTKLYHGTESFGFTAFDLSKMDDGTSIFLTNKPEIASTYSGVDNLRKISEKDNIDVDKLSVDDTAKLLNIYAQNLDFECSFTAMSVDEIKNYKNTVDLEIADAKNILKAKIKDNESNPSSFYALHKSTYVDLLESLTNHAYDKISTPLYVLLTRDDTFTTEQFKKLSNTEQNIRLLNKLSEIKSDEPIIVQKVLGGYVIEPLSIQEAKDELKANINKGNYSLFAKMDNPLIIDANKSNWNEIDVKSVLNTPFGDAIKSEYGEDYFNYGTQHLSTREVSKYAKQAGYDGVVFKNLKDNGGRNRKVSLDTASDVYIAFNPNNVKSADAITYDNNGEVIPLSERFNSSENDIRYNMRGGDFLSNREALAQALETTTINASERNTVKTYQQGLEQMNKLNDKLNEIDSKIKAINAKDNITKSDKAEIASLKKVKAETKEKIVNKDKSLLNLESTEAMRNIIKYETSKKIARVREQKNERIDEIRKQETQKRKDAVAKLRKQKNDKIDDIILKNREKHKADVEKRKDNQDWSHSISEIKKYSKKLLDAVLHPTEKMYIPYGLNEPIKSITSTLLDSINLDNDTKMSDNLRKLSQQLEQVNQSDEHYGDFYNAYNEEIIEEIKGFADYLDDRLEGVKIKKQTQEESLIEGLTHEEAKEIEQIVKDVYNATRDAVKQIGRQDAITNYESGLRIINQTRELGDVKLNVMDSLLDQVLSPMRLMAKYTGYNADAELMYHINALNEGTEKYNMFKMLAEKPLNDFIKENPKEYESFKNDVVEIKYRDNKNVAQNVKMTKSQGLQILMSWTREHTEGSHLDHMERGGVTLLDAEQISKGNYEKAFAQRKTIRGINLSFISAVQSQMGDFENHYRELAETLFNEVSNAYINDTSAVLLHRDIATEKYYIPFAVNKDFLSTEIDGLKYDATIVNKGMLKSTKRNAPQALNIAGLDSVISKHIRDVGQYYGYAVPIRNLNKALNVKMFDTNENGNKIATDSVRNALRETFNSDKPIQFIEQVMTDLQTSRKSNSQTEKVINKIVRAVRDNMITSALKGSVSVVIKQGASLYTASSILSMRSVSVGAVKGIQQIARKGGWKQLTDEIDAHTAGHYMRRIGLSSMEIEAMKDSWLGKKLPTALNPAKWIQGTDCITTALHWVATKEEVSRLYKEQGKADQIGSDEYFDEVTKLYDQILEETQPMYDSLHRGEIQKNSNELLKSVFMFKTQPLQNTGILYDAIMDYQANKDNAELRDAKKQKLAKAVSSQMLSALTFVAMTFIASLALHKPERYKDENDEVTLSSVLERLGIDWVETGFSVLVPIGGAELASFIENQINGKDYDFASDNVVSMLNDFTSSIGDFNQNVVVALAQGNFDLDKAKDALWGLSVDGLAFFKGFPLKNYSNIVNGIFSNLSDTISGHSTYFGSSGGRKGSEYANSYDVLIDNNPEKAKQQLETFYNEKYEEQIAKGETTTKAKKKAQTSVRTALTTQYKKEYQKAFLNNDRDKMQKISKKLQKSGYMKWDGKSLSTVLGEWTKSAQEDSNK